MTNLESFTYDALTRNQSDVTVARADGLSATAYPHSMRHIDPWIRLEAHLPAKRPGVRQTSGWKVHLSVHIEDVPAAWDAILPVLAPREVHAKVMTKSIGKVLGDGKHKQAGKTIALKAAGALSEDPKYLQGFLIELETALLDAEVRPGWVVRGDRPVPGGTYSYIRFDEDPSGHYSSGIDAFNPFSMDCPFDGVQLPAQGSPRLAIDAHDQGLRMLNLIEPGWQNTNGVAVIAMRDEVEAGDLYRSLRAYGLPAQINGTMLSVSGLADPTIRAGWHDAMEIRRAARIGRVLLSDPSEAKMTIRRRAAGASPPEVHLEFDEPTIMAHLLDALQVISSSGGAVPCIKDGKLVVPYGGRYHTVDGLNAFWEHSLRQAMLNATTNDPSLVPFA